MPPYPQFGEPARNAEASVVATGWMPGILERGHGAAMHLCSNAAVLFAIIIMMSVAGTVGAQDAHYGKNGPALLPDPTVTKGVVVLSDTQIVCTTVWGKDERHVTPVMKKQAYAQYGTAPRRASASA
jgi:hypothetical protein